MGFNIDPQCYNSNGSEVSNFSWQQLHKSESVTMSHNLSNVSSNRIHVEMRIFGTDGRGYDGREESAVTVNQPCGKRVSFNIALVSFFGTVARYLSPSG